MDNNSYYRLFLFIFIGLSLYTEATFGFTSKDTKVQCIEGERQALLAFKKGLVDDDVILSSWSSGENNKECCKWWGVKCSNRTGHVISLDLHSRFGTTGVLPHQLGNLTSLQTLDLGDNYGLTTNNLEWLSQLRSLRKLDLSFVYLNVTNWLQVVVNLPFLEELLLEGCWFDRPMPSSLVLPNSSSESLSILDLSYNHLTSSSTYPWLFNVSKNLVSIDLSQSSLEGPIPDAFGELISLEDIDLSVNLFEGVIPKSFQNLTHLRSLSLSDNQLNGSFLENFLLPPCLLYLDLSYNQITGNLLIQSSLQSLSQPSRLEFLDLSRNQISGLPSDLTVFSSLRELDLSSNKLRGRIPESIGQLSKLKILDLSSNFLEGEVSQVHFSRLFNLKRLYLSFNSLTLNMSSDWVPTFQLDIIKLVNCSMGPHFPQWLKTQNNFSKLDLSCGGISDTLPNWFWDLSPKLEYLNLSYNMISGKLPELSQKFIGYPEIDLSSNNFFGPILSVPPNLTLLHLYTNMFTGSVSFLCVMKGHFLRSLDLSDNKFSGDLPNCWMNVKELVILNLGNNNFFGQIPESFSFLNQIQTLHLRNNSFIGELPSTLKNCLNIEVLDIGGNKLRGIIPTWIGTHLRNLVILSLRSNKFYGNIPLDICHLSRIQLLDLSHNDIVGKIPQCLYNLTSLVQKNSSFGSIIFHFGMKGPAIITNGTSYMDNVMVHWKRQESEFKKILGYLKVIDLSSNKLVGPIPQEIASLRGLISLNLSANHLTGNIIEHIDQMEMLESLDLSRNQFFGEIPTGLAHLHYLSALDLSYNNLSGRIPSSTQLQSFNPSSYIGNNELCGLPLEKCHWDAFEPQPSDHKKNSDVQNEDALITKEFYMCMGFGFLFGLLGVFVIMLKGAWRNAYFRFLQSISDWLYVTSRVYMARLTRILRG